MNITILNGSPHLNGNTAIMANIFQKGAEAAGHNITVLNVARMNINGCQACQYCKSHDGKCVQQDEMRQVYQAMEESELVVFASPIYFMDMTAQMKAVIDRTYAYLGTGFPFQKCALLLNAGNPRESIFEVAIMQYTKTVTSLKMENIGIITAAGMTQADSMKDSPALLKVYDLANRL